METKREKVYHDSLRCRLRARKLGHDDDCEISILAIRRLPEMWISNSNICFLKLFSTIDILSKVQVSPYFCVLVTKIVEATDKNADPDW